MRCEIAREEIQNWLDLQGVQAMPPTIREHIGECDNCRVFIQRWNSIEVGLQAVREYAPMPSRDMTAGIRARLSQTPRPVRSPWHAGAWRLALAGACAAALLLALLFRITAGGHRVPLNGATPGSPSYANVRTLPHPASDGLQAPRVTPESTPAMTHP